MTRALAWRPSALLVVALLAGCDDGAPPPGFAVASGRLEAEELYVATKHAGRVIEVLVDEGDAVGAEQVVARMDPASLEAQLARADALAVEAREHERAAEALIVQRRSELGLAEKELSRALRLFRDNVTSQREVDVERSRVETARAALDAAIAQLDDAKAMRDAADAEVRRVHVDLTDQSLRAPRPGRVLYRLAEPGEVLAAGGRVLTLIDLADVYMTVFLPAAEAGRIALGDDARILADARPDRPLPARVTFVSPEAQFTPKQVETRSEREQLSFRVKVTLLDQGDGAAKPGTRGEAWIRFDRAAPWPPELE